MKQVKRLIGFLQFFRSFIPNLNEHLIPFYKHLRKNVSFEITDEIENAFKVLREKLQTTTTQTLRLAKPGMQYAILCDASYHFSGFVLMIEDYVKDNKGETVNSYAPVSFESKVFNTAQIKMSIYCKEFLSLSFALETFSHLIWGSEKPVFILTDNKSLTRFFQAKRIPPSLWNYVDLVTAFNIVVTHIPGKANAAADFLSHLQSNPNKTIELKLTDRISIREIEIDVRPELPDNTINELFADNLPVDLLHVVDINTLITLKQSGHYAQAVNQLKSLTSDKELQLTKYNRKTTEMNATQHTNPMDDYPELETTITNLKKEQNSDSVIAKVLKWMETESAPTTTIYSIEQKYLKQLRRLYREWNTLQAILCTRWQNVVQIIVRAKNNVEKMYRIHNAPTGGHLGITRTIQEIRNRFYCPNYVELVAD